MAEKVVRIEDVPVVASSSVALPDGELLLRLFEDGHWTLVRKGDGLTTFQASGQLDRMCYSPLPDVRQDG